MHFSLFYKFTGIFKNMKEVHRKAQGAADCSAKHFLRVLQEIVHAQTGDIARIFYTSSDIFIYYDIFIIYYLLLDKACAQVLKVCPL